MEESTMIQETEIFVRSFHATDFSGHDYAHIERVRRLALHIAKQEGGNVKIIELSALLHDVADSKLGGTAEKVATFLQGKVTEEEQEQILAIITSLSYKDGTRPPMRTIEGKIVQDADRLDAIGAIGIARTFQFAGRFGEPMHVPGLAPREPGDRTGETSALNHFEEKLFRLKDLMNTKAALHLAEERHRYMEEFVARFKQEWDGTTDS
ncbi:MULTISPECIES: HD domain-containing protein [Exiguobacterium]|uniref:HD domain-containing protein n=1 Tax=Exiguobacterium acetylicum TaxID=41170 RepID=A0ABX8GBP6_EXIAC|nr:MULTISPECIES: HD domain-containing protein [Exiguobacterium]AOT00081.1 phosphohydrolase [Exiguobacterium sp. U13-1]QWB31039.1 HD domain-containing protein [Exiguobacterium acetylicum]HCD59009.1 HD domain-containing protein [Exiguobacterium sp.]